MHRGFEMKIAFIVPGSGDRFYCENCLRDATMYRALRAAGHDAMAYPMYLAPSGEEFGEEERRLYFGAVSLYFGTGMGWKLPRPIRRFLDSSPVLSLAARLSGSTSPGGLGELTLKMIAGADGFFRAELGPLLAALEAQRPDAVILSNAMLLAFAAPIKARLGCVVACALQDEDSWVDGLPAQEAGAAWAAMAEKAPACDLFLAASSWYARFAAPKLGIGAERMRVLLPGIEAGRYEEALAPGSPVIGYLSRLEEKMGFGLLVDAFILLKSRPASATLRLRAAGGHTRLDTPFLRGVLAKARRAGVADAIEIVDARTKAERATFLSGLGLLSVPALRPEAIGAFQLEAMAAGLPLVLPRIGGFEEIAEAAGAGIMVEPGSAGALAGGIARILADGALARELGARGRAAARGPFGAGARAGELAELLGDASRLAGEGRSGGNEAREA